MSSISNTVVRRSLWRAWTMCPAQFLWDNLEVGTSNPPDQPRETHSPALDPKCHRLSSNLYLTMLHLMLPHTLNHHSDNLYMYFRSPIHDHVGE